MSKNNKDGDYYYKWISLIESDSVQNVLVEVKGKNVDAKKALECLVAISRLAFEHVRKGKEIKSLPADVLQLTEWFCSLYCSEPSKSTLRYLTCLYHIIHFFLKKSDLEHMATLLKIVVKFKQMNLKIYEEDAKTLHDPFTLVLSDAVVKVVSSENTPLNRPLVSTLLSLLLEIHVETKTLSNGKILLETILQAVQIVSKQDDKKTVCFITTGLNVLHNNENVKDVNVSIVLLFQIYKFLFCFQNKISGHHSALAAVKSQLDSAKWKFGGNVLQGECFLMACNSVNLFMWDCPENSMLKKIRDNIIILKAFKNSQGDERVHATCELVVFLMICSNTSNKQSIPMIPESCLEPFFLLVLDLYTILKDSPLLKSDLLLALLNMFFFLAEGDTKYDKQILQKCVSHVLKTQKCIEIILNQLRSAGHPNAAKDTSIVLARFANLIRTYHMARLLEEVVIISKPICNFICTLPSDVFENLQNVKSLELCFTCLVGALGIKQLGKVLECLVVWLSKCPQSSIKVFKTWGDFKHNKTCEGKEDNLETNFWTIVNVLKSDLENEWPPLNLSIAEIGNFLVEELRTYCVNRSLRGKPVISAVNALLDLDVDCLTHVKGLVIAMDITTSNTNFAELCTTYYNKSKSLITKLRKGKKNFDPVMFNCCMGDLLYAQLRCQLKNLRTECECEMVKLSVSPAKPLVAELPESKPDPNDTCDIATRYHHLCLAQQRKLMDIMDSAIRHWGFACGMLKNSPNAALDLKVTLMNLQDAGQLLKLYCDEVKEVKVWNLLLDMAVVVSDSNMIVCAAGELLTTNTTVAPELLTRVTDIILNDQCLGKTKWSYTLKCALFALKNNRIPDGLKHLKSFDEAENKTGVQISQYYSYIGQFQHLSDWKSYNHYFNSSPSFHFSLLWSLRRHLSHVKEKNLGSFGDLCEQQQELFTVSYLLGEANWALEQPREARCYLKTALPIAQKLALPLRTVQLLLLLAWVDLNTGVVDDCVVKLEGLEDLLELCGTPVVYGRSVVSPSLNKAVLRPPDYLSHPPACHCLPCTTVEYRRLVLETVTLRASFCAAYGLAGDAAQCFQVAKLVEEDLSKSDVREVCRSCATMWLRYADFKAAAQEYQEALTANEKALQLLSSVRDPTALQRGVEQKMILQYSLYQLRFAPIRAKVAIEVKKSSPSKIQTPTSLKSKAPENSPLAPLNKNVKSVTPFVRPVRRFRIPSSGEENTPVAVSKQKRKTKLPPKFVSETPQNVCKVSNSSAKPFVIVDDDGMAVGVSGTKTLSRARKKILDLEGSLQQPKNTSKKKLFSFENVKMNSKSDESGLSNDPDEPIITRRTKKTEIKSYGNSKLSSRKPQHTSEFNDTKQKIDQSKVGCSSDVFSFDQIKDSISEIDNIKSNTLAETTSSLPLKKQTSKSVCSQLPSMTGDSSKLRGVRAVRKVSIDSNCDFIEGTPPESLKKSIVLVPKKSVGLVPKRVTRSNKV